MPNIYVDVMPKFSEVGELAAPMPRREEFKARATEIADSLAEVASLFRARLDRNLQRSEGEAWALDGVELTFSLDLETEAGVIIARASAKAGFEAKLAWKRT